MVDRPLRLTDYPRRMILSLLTCLGLALQSVPGPARERPVFRFQLFNEPHGTDPQLGRSASSSYLFHALYRGLYAYRTIGGLVPDGAASCERRPNRLVCKLATNHRWSNGDPVTADRYVQAFRRLIDPKTASPHADLLFNLKNARAISDGSAAPATLGVNAPDAGTVAFEFAAPDYEFEAKLIHPALAPLPPGGYPPRERATELITSGVYRITRWKKDSWIHLEPNPHLSGHDQRPPAEAVFLDDDTTALTLFEAGKLSFLKRLVASEIPRFKSRPEFHQVPQARFDYIGLGPDLAGDAKLREALVKAVDFGQFLRLFDTRTPPGCISLPARYLENPTCQSYAGDGVPAVRAGLSSGSKPIDYYYSLLGGDDIQRAAEWFQGQWKKNLGLDVRLHSEEQSAYLARLRDRPPAIFRKGVSLDRPTCLSALEIFQPGHPENFLHLNDATVTRALEDLRKAADEPARKRACTKAVSVLLKTNRIIPLGEMYFTILVDVRFRGWDLNELNHLDFSRLTSR